MQQPASLRGEEAEVEVAEKVVVMRGATLLLAAAAAQASLLSGVFSSGAVLQRAPARAAVFGALAAAPGGPAHVTVNVSEAGGYAASFGAAVTPEGTWKALLDPRPAWGNYTLVAYCDAGCTSPNDTTGATLTGLTFGDVWYATGQ